MIKIILTSISLLLSSTAIAANPLVKGFNLIEAPPFLYDAD